MEKFKDRFNAGRRLAQALAKYKGQRRTIVLALPRGGVPVAYEIARALHLKMTVFLVRKLGVPGHEEVAMGAIAEGDILILDEPFIERLGISRAQIENVFKIEKQELKRRLDCYRRGESLPDLNGKNIILVDDGVATGMTLKVVVQALRTQKPKCIVLAVPLASKESLSQLSPLVDEVVCLTIPEPFYGVGNGYQTFEQMSDGEVLALLKKIRSLFNENFNDYDQKTSFN